MDGSATVRVSVAVLVVPILKKGASYSPPRRAAAVVAQPGSTAPLSNMGSLLAKHVDAEADAADPTIATITQPIERGGTWDIGAYEYTVSTTTTIVPPGPPPSNQLSFLSLGDRTVHQYLNKREWWEI